MTRAVWWLVLVAALCACNNGSNIGPAFPFERAEHMAFTCFAPLVTDSNAYVTLPDYCCRVLDPSTNKNVADGGVSEDGGDTNAGPVYDDAGTVIIPPECKFAGVSALLSDGGTSATGEALGTTLLHALVTQSTRGEVAAVDLVNDRVLDSDRLVPGFTFLDTGGLPSAIVSPPKLPRIVQPVGRTPITAGPAWTYVASAEEYQIRAIATCRFRSGGACGPDALPENQDPAYEQRTRVAMPAAPGAMVLGPGPNGPDSALWVTLPNLGLIARVEIAATPTVPIEEPGNGPQDAVRPVDAFELNEQRLPLDPAFFRVPVPASVTPPDPIGLSNEYTAMCGLNRDFKPFQWGEPLPLAPRTPATNTVEPNLMHFDAESGLLLVTDRVAPVIHRFTYAADGGLNALAPLPTGTPVRDFVITPRLPAAAADLLSQNIPAEDMSVETQRFLYAIDDQGLLMMFSFAHDATTGVTTLQPLLSPTPGVRYGDRIDVPAPITALDVVDTRSQSNWQCGEQTIEELNQQYTNWLNMPDSVERTNKLAQISTRTTIYNNASSTYLRGVFLAVASANGTLTMIDLHDLDVSCRARKECCTNETCAPPGASAPDRSQLLIARDTTVEAAVAVRRHAVRRSFVGQLETIVPNPGLLLPDGSNGSNGSPVQACTLGDEKYFSIDGLLCTPYDPWYAVAETWSLTWQGSIPNSQTTGARFQTIPGDNTNLTVLAPLEMNLCDLGVQPGDLVAVLGTPVDRLLSRCGMPSPDTASVFTISEAFADHLVIHEPTDVDPTSLTKASTLSRSSQLRDINEITTCYPDLVGIELRTGGFLVIGASGEYLHRITTGADGSCVVDTSKDPLFTARPTPMESSRVLPDGSPCPAANPAENCATDGALTFKNPYIEFIVAPGVTKADQTLRNTTVQVRNASAGLSVTSVPTGDSTTDALPAELRYEPLTGALFLLDTASQGLRRYVLQPFEYDTNSFQ